MGEPEPRLDGDAAVARSRGTLARSPLLQLTLARWREFYREPEALFWAFGFPLLMAIALGVAFQSRGPETTFVAVEDGPGAAEIARALDATPSLRAEVVPPNDARDRLRTGKVALAIVPPARPGDPIGYRFDPTRPDSRLGRALADEALQRAAGRRDARPTASLEVTERGSRYIDFLIPGLIGMNVMSDSMWSIGWAIVQARSRKLLKRFAATPMKRHHYLLALMLSRLLLLVIEVGGLAAFGWLVFGVRVAGSIAALSTVAVLGALAFSGLGLLVACRGRTVEAVSGLMNLTMLPMFVASGVFFSSAHFPEAMQPFIRALPLTALNDALRAVMIDGRPLAALWRELSIVGAWGLASFVAALRLFRWS